MRDLKNYNIIVIGDSVAKGLYLKKGSIEKTEENAVAIVANHYGCEIHNCSTFGQTLKRVCDKSLHLKYAEKYIDAEKRNVIVISLGGNDADYDWEQVCKAPNMPHTDKTPLDEFNGYIQKIIDDLKQFNARIIFTTFCPIDSERYFNNVIKKKYNGKIIKKFLDGDLSNLYRHQDCYNIAVMHKAHENNCAILDIRTELLQEKEFLKYLSDDGIHPNALGQTYIANLAIKFIEMRTEDSEN